MPYGPTYDPSKPYDGIERGILFHFINANIENQYEFVQRRWVNDGEFAGAVRLDPRSKDPLAGTQDPAESIFVSSSGRRAPADRGDGSLELRDDQSRGVRVPAEHHGHQLHCRLVRLRFTGEGSPACGRLATASSVEHHLGVNHAAAMDSCVDCERAVTGLKNERADRVAKDSPVRALTS